MDRRSFIQASALIAGGWCSPCDVPSLLAQTASTESTPQTASFRVRAGGRQPAIADNFLGLGYEMSSVARPNLLHPANRTYVNLVQTLGRKGVIRIGGNTGDYARYASAATSVSSPYGTVVNDAQLRDLGAFLSKTGWQLIWALNLGNGSIENAVAEARAVRGAAGASLLAFEIGNEPDLFSHEKHRPAGYSYSEWLADYRRYKVALRARLPGVPFAGPDVAGATEWVTRFAADEGDDLSVLTHHYYREGQNPGSSIDKLFDPDPKLAPQLTVLREASAKSRVPYRICEVNSFSGGGRPGVSNTFAAALWVLDYMFTLATYGCSGVNLESGVNQLGFVSSYSPIGDDERGRYSARPEYYGMLAFAIAGKGQLLSVESAGISSRAKLYATSQADGSLQLTMINKSAIDVAFQVKLDRDLLPGGSGKSHASILGLRAPSIDAKNGVTLGGSEVTSTGEWAPSLVLPTALKDARLRVTVAAGTASIASLIRR